MAEASNEQAASAEPAGTSKPLYRCKLCNTTTPKPSHHKMTSCECGAVCVDHGWYGSRVLWKGGRLEDVAEIVNAAAGSNGPPNKGDASDQ